MTAYRTRDNAEIRDMLTVAAAAVARLDGMDVTSATVYAGRDDDFTGVDLSLDGPSAVRDGAVAAVRLSLPLSAVSFSSAWTRWSGSSPDGSDLTVTAYGAPEVEVYPRRRLPYLRPQAVLAVSALAGAVLTLAARRALDVAR